MTNLMIDGVLWECLGELGVRESSRAVNVFCIGEDRHPLRDLRPITTIARLETFSFIINSQLLTMNCIFQSVGKTWVEDYVRSACRSFVRLFVRSFFGRSLSLANVCLFVC